MKAYPMPNPQDLFASSAGGRYFSRLDMKQAYQQMKVSENSRQYPIINTSNGSFVYTRMPLGVSSAPSIWQRAMDGILAGIPGVECYLDDALLIGKTEQEHDGRLQAVLERPSDLGLRLKKEKCEFRQQRLEYLGHVIDSQGLRPSERNWLLYARHQSRLTSVS
jgi:hypothetical protein